MGWGQNREGITMAGGACGPGASRDAVGGTGGLGGMAEEARGQRLMHLGPLFRILLLSVSSGRL